MSSYHIREIAEDIKTVNVVFHIPVPVGNNAVGLAWQTALVMHLGGADQITSKLPEVVGTAEETNMKAGAILEKLEIVRFSSLNLTNAERLVEVITAYTNTKNSELLKLQITLNFFGKIGDVV